MEIIIYTSYPCHIKYGNQSEHINQNEHLLLEKSDNEIIVQPLKSKPFIIDLKNPTPLYRIIEKDDKILVFLLDGLLAENVVCHNFNYDGNKSSIEISTKNITFIGNTGKKIIHLISPISDVKVGSFSYINYASFHDSNNSTIIAYNPKKNTARIFSANKIEITKNGFILHKTDFYYKNIIEEYYIDNEGLKLKNKNFNLVESASMPSETIPFKFMTYLKNGDYKSTKSMLSPSLSSKLSESAIKEYFGEISYFYMLDPMSCFAISNNQNQIYNFSILDDKITDIQET